MKVICHNLVLSKEHLYRFNIIIENNENLLNSNYFLKINKAISFISFILREIHCYLNIRLNDNVMLNDINLIKKEILRLKEKNKLIKLKL
jgi:hypothetical protein